jgi:hypothetical protein
LPETESFELQIPEGTVRVEGFIPDRRYALELRMTMPFGRVMRVWVSRRGGGAFVDWEDDEHVSCGGGLQGCVAAVLGYGLNDERPPWVDRFIHELYEKLQIRE